VTELQIDDALREIDRPDDESVCVLALDIGGTLVKGGVMRSDRTLCSSVRIPTPFGGGDHDALMGKVKATLRDLFGQARADCALEPVAIGVASPGLVDETSGVVRSAYNLNWSEVEIVRELETEFGLPVTLRQDARAAALIEQRVGVARDTSDFLFVAIGTGIGAALVLDGVPRAGAHHRAGEIGHIEVDAQGDACACGERGCLETIASTRAIALRYNRRRRRNGIADLDAEGVLAQLHAGDELAREVWAEATDALASVLAAVQKTVDVELVVLGGGLAMAGDALLEPLEKVLNAPSPVVEPARLAVSSVGQLAGLLGAGTAALEYVASNHG
jgi:glucokinase